MSCYMFFNETTKQLAQANILFTISMLVLLVEASPKPHHPS